MLLLNKMFKLKPLEIKLIIEYYNEKFNKKLSNDNKYFSNLLQERFSEGVYSLKDFYRTMDYISENKIIKEEKISYNRIFSSKNFDLYHKLAIKNELLKIQERNKK